MPLVDMRDMLNHAYQNGYAIGSFDLVGLDFVEAIVDAAEQCRSPVILSLAQTHFEHYDFELAMAAVEKAAQRAAVPLAIHLDHGSSHESAVQAIRFGCNSVMVDISHEPFPSNVSQTQRVAETAHGCGVAVEGELGYVAGAEGEDAEKHSAETAYTSVGEAKAYVERTGVDCLAVSVGTIHGRLRGRPRLDFERLRRINEAVKIPLVIHGGSGLSDTQYRKLVDNGVAKINYYTALADAAGGQIRTNAKSSRGGGYTDLTRGVRTAIRTEAERCMRLFGSTGRAAEVLAQCRPWRPVEHMILFNAENVSDAQLNAILAHGRDVLAKIPGVRRVFAGWAVPDRARYRLCWLIEFAHEQVIDSYRDHPDHVAFASQFFRPVAGDRISIDFAESCAEVIPRSLAAGNPLSVGRFALNRLTP